MKTNGRALVPIPLWETVAKSSEAKLRKPKELQSRTNVTVEIEGEDKPAIVADWIGLIYFA